LDYVPFGYAIPASAGGRQSVTDTCGGTAVATYSQAPVSRLEFTGKERDSETGLDYFGARYFSSAQGRWTSPDWSEKPEPIPYADLKDPQSLNLYSYVRNNPLTIGTSTDTGVFLVWVQLVLHRQSRLRHPLLHLHSRWRY
jgi:RHS repeat-associated protein